MAKDITLAQSKKQNIAKRFLRRALSAVLEWHVLHKDALMTNWEAALSRKPLSKMEPLE
ncbi:MAG: hypothetical protein BECKG1743E_GA0114224_106427 [Candidatus Kentron sp. G]|nr:MAG: hypothetical protein BECKG1743E_GA0114224_106427 [Candidatus Kentron sp. G]